jgi:putative transposon-encoded protein
LAYGIHFLNTTDEDTVVHCDAWPAHYERDVPPFGGTGTPLVPPSIIVKRVWVIGYYSASNGQLLAERGGISVENGSQLCTLKLTEGNYTIEFSDF